MTSVQASARVAPTPDPLLARTALPHRAEYYPYGFAVTVASNSPTVLEAAGESWAGLPKRFDKRPVEVRCVVSKGAKMGCPPPPVVRAQRNLTLWTADEENSWCCDLSAGFGCGWVTERVAANTRYLRYHLLEAMAYSMLESLYVVAVHAACVALDGSGVLLAGESGAGKSSLAYACARSGWTYISDDCSHMLRRSRTRIVLGDPRRLRFRATAGAIFPEFQGLAESPYAHGKPTIEVLTDSLPAIRTAVRSRVDALVFLNRGAAGNVPADLIPISEEEAAERLLYSAWPADLPTEPARRSAIERLAAAGAYELRYCGLDAAVCRLNQLVGGERR
jgi:hypothetical protein